MSAAGTSFYTAGGTLRFDSPSYVERQADRDLYDGLIKSEFCYVLTPRQMGKSSLMVRTAARLRQQGINVIVLDLTAIGQNLTPEQWYDGLSMSMGRQTRLEDELDDFWRAHERLSPVQRFITALRQVVMPRRPGPFVVFVDESDTVRSLPFSTDEFFAAIRECYNRRPEDPEFHRLCFCLLGVATPNDLIRDTRITPFNIGRRIELNDFTPGEAAPLANGLGREPKTAARLFERILHWTNGHPYLTQRLCQTVAGEPAAVAPSDIDQMCDTLFLSNRAKERDDNLLFVRDRLLRSEVSRADLLSLYERVRRQKKVPDNEVNPLVTVLRLSGIVRVERGELRVRNRIYEKVFDDAWVAGNMPSQEIRRQREAFRRGLLRGSVYVAIIAAVSLWASWLVKNQLEAREIRSAIQRLGSVYGEAHSYADFLEMKEDILLEGGTRVINSILATFRTRKPDKLFMEIKVSKGVINYDVVLSSDGRQTLVYLPNLKQYLTAKPSDSLRDVWAHAPRDLDADLSETIYSLILAAQPRAAFAEQAKDARFVREEEFQGVPAYVVTWREAAPRTAEDGSAKPIEATAWVARGDGRILQVVKDLTGTVNRGGMPGFSGPRRRTINYREMVLRMTHSDVQIDPDLPDASFVVSPAADAQKVERFQFPGFGPGNQTPPPDRDREPQIDRARLTQLIPPRSPSLGTNLIDLTPHYNAALTEPWHFGGPENTLALLPQGLQNFSGIHFDVRGLVQLAGRGEPSMNQRFPRLVRDILIQQKCSRIHFLHASVLNAPEGTTIGHYLIRYTNGGQRLAPLISSFNVDDWRRPTAEPDGKTGLEVAWRETPSNAVDPDRSARLYKLSWENPLRFEQIESVDFVSAMSSAAPFLVAITVD